MVLDAAASAATAAAAEGSALLSGSASAESTERALLDDAVEVPSLLLETAPLSPFPGAESPLVEGASLLLLI